jgi:hypothetical protein
MSLERIAKNYVKLGMHVVPYGQNGHPNVKDYLTPGVAATTVEDVDYKGYNWRYGVGVVLSLSNLIMVDIDMHDPRAENGLLSLEMVCKRYAEGGSLPETWAYATPRGGRHLLFRRPEQVQELIDTYSLTNKAPEQNGRQLLTWRLPTCPLERARTDARSDGHAKGSEGNAAISYATTYTPMFHCFEGKCVDLVDCEFGGDWWKALLDSLGVVERLTGEEVLHHLETKEPLPTPTVSASAVVKKAKKPQERRDDRGALVADCRGGLTPPWESHSEEERNARLAELDAFIEKDFAEDKIRMSGFGRTVEERVERNQKLRDPNINPTTLFTTEAEWKRWNSFCRVTRHAITCYFCDVPIDELQQRLDRRFAITHEEREAERARIEKFYDYYKLQTTEVQ